MDISSSLSKVLSLSVCEPSSLSVHKKGTAAVLNLETNTQQRLSLQLSYALKAAAEKLLWKRSIFSSAQGHIIDIYKEAKAGQL